MKLIVKLMLLGALASFAAGCNTMQGLGQDVQSGGRAVENSAEDVQKKL